MPTHHVINTPWTSKVWCQDVPWTLGMLNGGRHWRGWAGWSIEITATTAWVSCRPQTPPHSPIPTLTGFPNPDSVWFLFKLFPATLCYTNQKPEATQTMFSREAFVTGTHILAMSLQELRQGARLGARLHEWAQGLQDQSAPELLNLRLLPCPHNPATTPTKQGCRVQPLPQ